MNPSRDTTARTTTTGTGVTPDVTRLDLGAGWHAAVHHTWELPAALRARWDEMALAYGDRGIFLCTGWLQTWWGVFGVGGRLFVAVVSCGEAVRGIFPCWIAPDGRLTGLANEVYYDFLIDAAHRTDTLDRFLEVLARSRYTRADLPYLSRLEVGGAAIQERLRRHRYRFWTWEQSYGPKVDVTKPTWEATEATFHSRLRNSLKKGRRRAEKEGLLTFEEVRDPGALDAVLDEAFAVEGSGWKAERGTAIRLNPEKAAWYRGISRWAARRGVLRVYLLRLNGRLIAFDLDIESGRTLFALKTGYDEQVATRFSAGNLMRCEVLKLAHARPDTHLYDFLGETFPWKLEWTPDADVCTDIFFYPPTVAGWTRYVRQYGWKQPLKRSGQLVRFIRSFRISRT
jgi:hypothetical protein